MIDLLRIAPVVAIVFDAVNEEKQEIKIEQEIDVKQHAHVFSSTPDIQLPTYLNADTLEVGVNEYIMDPNEIGSGSFAFVYKGVHTASKREVVI